MYDVLDIKFSPDNSHLIIVFVNITDGVNYNVLTFNQWVNNKAGISSIAYTLNEPYDPNTE